MLDFNTTAARDIANNNAAFTSLDVAKNILSYLGSDVANGLKAKINMIEAFAIGEHAVRHGAYQMFTGISMDINWSMRINNYSVKAYRVPGINRVVFHLTDGQWYTRTVSVEVLRDFLKKVVNDESNNSMFNKR